MMMKLLDGVCFGEHIEIANWLVDICDNYYIEIEDNKIKSWKIIK